MNTLSRYLMGLLGPRLLFILSALVIFIISVDVMISVDDIMKDGERGGFAGLLNYTFLRVPESISKLLGPSIGQKSVHVYEPSWFGSAIIINARRGQMCKAFFSS